SLFALTFVMMVERCLSHTAMPVRFIWRVSRSVLAVIVQVWTWATSCQRKYHTDQDYLDHSVSPRLGAVDYVQRAPLGLSGGISGRELVYRPDWNSDWQVA